MADERQWRIGVCVTLKSGSPKMVIYEGPTTASVFHPASGDAVSTVWFDGGTCREGKFLIACLNLAPE